MAHEVGGYKLLQPGVIGANKETVQHLIDLRQNQNTSVQLCTVINAGWRNLVDEESDSI